MTEMPVFQRTMNPLLEVLRESPAPLPIEELDRRVVARMDLPADVLAIPHDAKKPDRSEVEYRIAWARTWLKKSGHVTNPRRGFWTVTDLGRTAGAVDVAAVLAKVTAQYRADKKPANGAAAPPATDDESTTSPEDEEDGDVSAATDEDEVAAARVGAVVAGQLRDAHEQVGSEGGLATPEQLSVMLGRFRERFGPRALAGLDGVPLLTRMHGRGTKDSLVHWLEFKDDEEFSTSRFGSIAGGSALKFGMYQASETQAWMTGPPQQPTRLSTEDAIARARRQRDELLAAARILEAAGPADHIDYEALHDAIVEAAPEVGDTAWGHKLLSVWFPDLLDHFHSRTFQGFQLLRLLKVPSNRRYEDARFFVGIARQLGLSLVDLQAAVSRRNGAAYATWRIGTSLDAGQAWDAMRAGSFIAIGWDKLGDLSDVDATKAGKEAVRARLEADYPNTPQMLSRKATEIFHFVRGAQDRDLVVAMNGAQVLGVGRIVGPYEHVAGDPLAHRRKVQWELAGEPWSLPETEGLRTTFVQLQRHPMNLVEIEARLLAPGAPAIVAAPLAVPAPSVVAPSTPPAAPPPVVPVQLPPLKPTVARIDSVLQRKRQVILYGPPGTGKTHWALAAASELIARAWFQRTHADLDDEQRVAMVDARAIEIVSFHPGYGYEDFLEGFRPGAAGTQIGFELRDGLFKRVCWRAQADTSRPYVLVIDEINRGDLPRIFGELMTVIERDKRGRPITLPLSGEAFAVPDNVLVIGTMNTADRSIALLDAALRRRFGFVELLPDATTLRGVRIGKVPLAAWLDALNDRILEHAGRDARNLRVGHAYFMSGGAPLRDRARFAEVLRDDLIPLLEEVCYEDFDALERILGPTIVLRQKKRIAVELFETDRLDDLEDAILAAFPDISTTKAAAEADVTDKDVDEDAEDDAEDGEEAADPVAPAGT